MQLQIIILSAVSQKEKDKYMVSLTCGIKYDTNEPVYKTEIDSQRTDLWLPGEGMAESGLGVWDLQMRTITYRMDKQQGPTVQHRELYSISCDKP